MNLITLPRGCKAAVAAMAVAAAMPLVLGGAPVAAQGPEQGSDAIPVPDQTLSADGRTVTAGETSLTVSEVSSLDPAGQTLTVSGSGYDESKGIYVAFCVLGARDEAPTPCGGGAALEGSTGASVWISSNPPRYGVDLVVPWGPDGTFATELTVVAEIGDADCREVQCAVVTRNDHTRSDDRSQDLYVPVTFDGGDAPALPGDGLVPSAEEGDATSATAATSGTGGSSVAAAVVVAAAVLALLVVAAIVAVRRRRSR